MTTPDARQATDERSVPAVQKAASVLGLPVRAAPCLSIVVLVEQARDEILNVALILDRVDHPTELVEFVPPEVNVL